MCGYSEVTPIWSELCELFLPGIVILEQELTQPNDVIVVDPDGDIAVEPNGNGDLSVEEDCPLTFRELVAHPRLRLLEELIPLLFIEPVKQCDAPVIAKGRRA